LEKTDDRADAPDREPTAADADAAHADEAPLPWVRRSAESAAAWHAFRAYRDLGPRRSLDAVDRLLYPPATPGEHRESAAPDGGADAPRRRRGCIGRWSRAHEWVARAAAWDAHLDREARISQVEAVRAMNARHASIAKAVQAKAVEALRLLAAGEMDAADVIRCIVEGSKLERLALGQVTDAVRQDVKAEGGVTLEVVERIVVVGDRPRPGPPPLPTAVAGADDAEGAGEGGGGPPEFELPDESPFAACRLGVG
jgi:uncharacterized membrane protein